MGAMGSEAFKALSVLIRRTCGTWERGACIGMTHEILQSKLVINSKRLLSIDLYNVIINFLTVLIVFFLGVFFFGYFKAIQFHQRDFVFLRIFCRFVEYFSFYCTIYCNSIF